MRHFATFLLVLLFVFTANLQAAWLDREPQTVIQPDGTIVHCFATGDEFYNWLHDDNGFTIIKDHQTGYYVYAGLSDEQLVPTAYIAGQSDPAGAGLQPWLNIPPEKMQERRAYFLRNYMPSPPHREGFDEPLRGGNVGTYNNLIVYIRFSDQTEFTTDTTYYYNLFNNDTPGYNSMYNYFKEVSYDQLWMPGHFFPIPTDNIVLSYQDIYPRSYFMPYDPNSNPNGYQNDNQRRTREHQLLKRAVEYIHDEVPTDLDIDYNNDGYVDNVVFIIRGGTTAWATLLWPHRWVLYSENVYIHGKRVWDYNFNIETSVQNSGVGVLAHEMNHSLGAPDLYLYNSHPVTPVGVWDLMAANQNPPQSMGAYMKYRYGHWIDDIPEITECGVYTLEPVTSQQNNCFKIASPNSATDYFVVEYRRKAGTFESSLPASGLLIYRIDAIMHGQGNAQGPPNEVYIYRPNGTNYVNGNLQQAVFGEDYGRTAFNDNTNPSCFLSNDLPGGVDISEIGLIGETITFRVNFEKAPVAGFEASRTLITQNCTVDFLDLSLCQVDEWEWTFEGGTPQTSSAQHPQGIFYENAGVYNVALKVYNQWGEHTKVMEQMIEVSANALPEVDFTASDTLACTDRIVHLIDHSTICPIAWQWEITPAWFEFVDGSSAASQHPEVIFTDPGLFAVKLTVHNANGASELLKESYIQAGGVHILDFDGSFEAQTLAAHGWTVDNPDDDITWTIWDVAGSGDGDKAAGINLFDYGAFNQRDRLISPPIDFNVTESGWLLRFKHAYARLSPHFTDSLNVYISDDCGDSWTRLLTVADNGSGNFVTREPITFGFIPMVQDDWCGSGYGANCFELDIDPWIGNRNIKIMFESVSINGNNLFIDEVRFDFSTNINNNITDVTTELINIYPNPATDEITVWFESERGQYLIEIIDTQGRTALRTEVVANDHLKTQNYSLKGFPKGIYIVKVSGEALIQTKKLVIR
jgi:M6 family metalloprotease-like protein